MEVEEEECDAGGWEEACESEHGEDDPVMEPEPVEEVPGPLVHEAPIEEPERCVDDKGEPELPVHDGGKEEPEPPKGEAPELPVDEAR